MIFVLFSPVLRPYMWNEKKISTSCPRNTPTNVCSNDFKILKKTNDVWKLWDLSIPHYITCGGSGKKLSRFCNIFTYNAYKWKHLRRSFIELRNTWLGLDRNWRSNWSSTSKLFRWVIDNIYCFLLIFDNFLYQFNNFYVLNIIIKK